MLDNGGNIHVSRKLHVPININPIFNVDTNKSISMLDNGNITLDNIMIYETYLGNKFHILSVSIKFFLNVLQVPRPDHHFLMSCFCVE